MTNDRPPSRLDPLNEGQYEDNVHLSAGVFSDQVAAAQTKGLERQLLAASDGAVALSPDEFAKTYGSRYDRLPATYKEDVLAWANYHAQSTPGMDAYVKALAG